MKNKTQTHKTKYKSKLTLYFVLCVCVLYFSVDLNESYIFNWLFKVVGGLNIRLFNRFFFTFVHPAHKYQLQWLMGFDAKSINVGYPSCRPTNSVKALKHCVLQ